MKIKEEHKDLKKKVNFAEKKRNTKRGTKSWHDLRTLKKLKLKMKDKLSKSKQGWGSLSSKVKIQVATELHTIRDNLINDDKKVE